MRYSSVNDDWKRPKTLQHIQRRPSRVGAARHAIRCAVLAALTVLGALQSPASADTTPLTTEREAVIRPGQETVVADMLGQGATLPDGCAFAGGHIDKEAVIGTYRCATGEVGIELRHPSIASSDAYRTAQFALTVTKGTPPQALIDALAARIRAHEDKFEWTLQPVMSKGTAPLPLPRLGAAALVLVLAAAAWWMGGRALRARRSGVSRPGQRDPDLDGQ